jgi:hypothetical protein
LGRSARPIGTVGWASAAAGAAVACRSTPLHCAAANGTAAVTAALLGAGADASIKDNYGYAALRRAVRADRHQLQPRCPQEDGRASSTKVWKGRRVRGGGGAGAWLRRSPSPPPRRNGAALTFMHSFSTRSPRASHAATAPLVVRFCTRASIRRARHARSAAAIGTSVRVCCCVASARTASGNQDLS